jgi:hypothetical protein
MSNDDIAMESRAEWEETLVSQNNLAQSETKPKASTRIPVVTQSISHDDYYEEDEFDSLSKSQLSVSRIKQQAPTTTTTTATLANVKATADTTITCFECKQKIPKSQVVSHREKCKKTKTTLSRKSIDESEKYSAISE